MLAHWYYVLWYGSRSVFSECITSTHMHLRTCIHARIHICSVLKAVPGTNASQCSFQFLLFSIVFGSTELAISCELLFEYLVAFTWR